MAENDVSATNQQEVQQIEQEKLKYLEFVQVAVLNTAVYASKAYSYAKDKSGPLKSGVETIEGTLKTVVGPAYQKFHNVPVVALKFVDRKVDEVKTAGVVGTATELAKTTYTKLEPIAENFAVIAWQSLNQVPVFTKVANVVVPKAAYYSERYNQTVQQTADKGYKVSSYLPLVPTERIAKVFSSGEPQDELVVPNGSERSVEIH